MFPGNNTIRICTLTGGNRPDIWTTDPFPNATDPGQPTHIYYVDATSCVVGGASCHGSAWVQNEAVYTFALDVGDHVTFAVTNSTSQTNIYRNEVDSYLNLIYTDVPPNVGLDGGPNLVTFDTDDAGNPYQFVVQ